MVGGLVVDVVVQQMESGLALLIVHLHWMNVTVMVILMIIVVFVVVIASKIVRVTGVVI
jgi:hypothetical protein